MTLPAGYYQIDPEIRALVKRDEHSRLPHICFLSGTWFPCYKAASLYCLCLSGKNGCPS